VDEQNKCENEEYVGAYLGRNDRQLSVLVAVLSHFQRSQVQTYYSIQKSIDPPEHLDETSMRKGLVDV
jgi:hypothetical protein